jgi:GTP-binding protein
LLLISPGLTRDRKYGEGEVEGQSFIAIDTGGITGDEEGIDLEMAAQSLQAIAEANIVLFMVDAKDGLMPDDHGILDYLRKREKHTYLVANKIDGLDPDIALADFYSLGFTEVHPITATQGRGVKSLLLGVLEEFAEIAKKEKSEDDFDIDNVAVTGIKIAIAGRPNVGKSTLVNRMLGEDRVVVYDQPGTTRDSIYIPFERRGQRYTLIDTAGIRKRGRTRETVEKFSVVKSLQSIQDANVVVLVVDARTGIVEQDLHLLGYVIDTGRALVIALNKWDGMDQEGKEKIKSDIQRRFTFVNFAKFILSLRCLAPALATCTSQFTAPMTRRASSSRLMCLRKYCKMQWLITRRPLLTVAVLNLDMRTPVGRIRPSSSFMANRPIRCREITRATSRRRSVRR